MDFQPTRNVGEENMLDHFATLVKQFSFEDMAHPKLSHLSLVVSGWVVARNLMLTLLLIAQEFSKQGQ